MTIVLKAENISKKYIISHTANSSRYKYSTIRDSIYSIFSNKNKQEKEDFWALKDINFEINQGDKIGIIGRNGAGKSTLLKILSRITDPTIGKISIKGKIASLLEVGTGFHPELTGRENIFLNGSILGMTHKEIKKKFDEIVEFSGVENFLDTPVKRYSSGMYVRLAFSVAAHLETDILLVDEVLAVGDAEFQKKCLGKMDDISKSEGRTILFVSHNMGIIQSLCNKSFIIDKGSILYSGKTSVAVDKYLNFNADNYSFEVDLSEHKNRLGKMKKILKRAYLKNKDNISTLEFSQADNIILVIEYDATNKVPVLAGAGFAIYTIEGIRVCGGNNYMKYKPPYSIPIKGIIEFDIDSKQFTPGTYYITISVGSHQGVLEDKIENVLQFTIYSYDIYETGYLLTKEDGVMSLNFESRIKNDK